MIARTPGALVALGLLASAGWMTDAAAGSMSHHANAPAMHQQFDAGMQRMMEAMHAAPVTGNADVDFAAMMLPHHQGAIDMARHELQFGTDPAMRRLAQEIIVTQQSEIELMRKRAGELAGKGPTR